MLENINPFPPLIFKEHFRFNSVHLSAATEILALADNQGKIFLEKGNAASSVSNQQLPPHRHPAFQDYFSWEQNIAEKIILEIYKLSSNVDYVVGNSWVNCHGNNGQTLEHCHGLSSLSCVAYLKLPENSGFTEFKDPHYGFRSLHERSDDDADLKEWSAVPVIEGDVLFFPGWIQHRSQPNESAQDRWIISSNYVNFSLLQNLKFGNLWSK